MHFGARGNLKGNPTQLSLVIFCKLLWETYPGTILCSFSNSSRACSWRGVTFHTVYVKCPCQIFSFFSHRAEPLRPMLPVNSEGIVYSFRLAQKDKEGFAKHNKYLPALPQSLSAQRQRKSHTETGSSLYCVSWGVHLPVQKHSLRRFISSKAPHCETQCSSDMESNSSRKRALFYWCCISTMTRQCANRLLSRIQFLLRSNIAETVKTKENTGKKQ